jgi:hypothetical protein
MIYSQYENNANCGFAAPVGKLEEREEEEGMDTTLDVDGPFDYLLYFGQYKS